MEYRGKLYVQTLFCVLKQKLFLSVTFQLFGMQRSLMRCFVHSPHSHQLNELQG